MVQTPTNVQEARAFFAEDHFATDACRCRVVEAKRGYAVCAFDIADVHRNQMGNVMGGAIFTLADFAMAVASNTGENPTVSVCNTIEFLSATKGSRLIATARADKSGRSMGFYTVEVADDLGVPVARMTGVGARRGC